MCRTAWLQVVGRCQESRGTRQEGEGPGATRTSQCVNFPFGLLRDGNQMTKKPRAPPVPAAPISDKDLRRYLDTQDDFALELEAYRHARGFGFHATHAHLYDDAKTNKRRQYDVRASHDNGLRRIDLTIECKSLNPIYPLLVQRVPRPRDDSFHQIMQSRNSVNAHGVSKGPPNWVGSELLRMSGTHMYDSQQQVGKSMKRIEARGDGSFAASDSDVYEKYTQALTSMNQVVQSAAQKLRPQHAGPGYARAFLPIVVVSDNALWVADYDASATLTNDPTRTDDTSFFLGWEYEIPHPQDPAHPATFTISHLHIMTRSRLPLFLKDIHEGGMIWDQLFGPEPDPATPRYGLSPNHPK
jgi:hypothetical protein